MSTNTDEKTPTLDTSLQEAIDKDSQSHSNADEEETIDGLHFPKALPSNILDQSFASLGSLAVEDASVGPSSIRDRIGIFQKSTSSSSSKAKPPKYAMGYGSYHGSGELKQRRKQGRRDFDGNSSTHSLSSALQDSSGHNSSLPTKSPKSSLLKRMAAYEDAAQKKDTGKKQFAPVFSPSPKGLAKKWVPKSSNSDSSKNNNSSSNINNSNKKGKSLFESGGKSSAVPDPPPLEGSVTDTLGSSASSLVLDEASPHTPVLSIADRINQYTAASRGRDSGIDERSVSGSAVSATDKESRRIDYAARRYLMESSATKIQAVTRGYFYRKRKKQQVTDTVIKWLKQHKLVDLESSMSTLEISEDIRQMAVDSMAAEIEEMAGAPDTSNSATEEAEDDAANVKVSPQPVVPVKEDRLKARTRKYNQAATTIQALARGYICRKFNLKAMVFVVSWIKEHQEEALAAAAPVQEFEPDEEALETVWTFLESNNTWTKKKSVLDADASSSEHPTSNSDETPVESMPPDKIDVTDLVNTWEWLVVNESKQEDVASPAIEIEPTKEDLTNLANWLEQNDLYPTAQNDEAGSGVLGENVEGGSMGLGVAGDEDRAAALRNKISTVPNKLQGESTVEAEDISTREPGKIGTTSLASNRSDGTSIGSLVYQDNSVAAGGSIERLKVGSRAFRDESISSGGSGIKPRVASKPGKLKNMDEILEMWKWLATHGMDMKQFQQTKLTGNDMQNKTVQGRRVHRMHDDFRKGGDGIQYIDEDLSGSYQDLLSRSGGAELEKPNYSYNRHHMHDEVHGKGDGIQYIDEDLSGSYADLSGSPGNDASDTKKSDHSFNRHKMHDELHGKGDGIQYIDEDLSGSYADLTGSPGSDAEIKKVDYPFNRYKMHDELNGKGDGIQYIDEDLSGSYTDLTGSNSAREAPGTKEDESIEKPSLKSMVNYWNFSSHHARRHPIGDEDGDDDDDGSEDGLHSEDAGEDAKQKEVVESNDWKKSAANNDFVGTLAWLKSRGIELNKVKPAYASTDEGESDDLNQEEPPDSVPATERSTDDNESDEDGETDKANLPTKTDMAETLRWLESRGYSRAKKHSSKAEGQPSPSEKGSLEEHSEFSESEIVEMTERKSGPSPAEVTRALKWLDSKEEEDRGSDTERGTEDNKNDQSRRERSGRSVAEDENKPKNKDDFRHILYSLSWLKQHGFDLDRKPGSTPTAPDVLEALTSIDAKPESGETSTASHAKETSGEEKKKKDDISQTLAWLSQRGLKLPSQSKKKSKEKTGKTESPGSKTAKSKTAVHFTAEPNLELLQRKENKKDEISSSFESPRKMKARVTITKEPNGGKQSPKAKEGQTSSALQWLQFKKGINVEDLPKPAKPPKSPRRTGKAKLSSVSPIDDISLHDAEAAIKSGLGRKEGTSAPASKDMEQALSWLKLRESRRRAQTVAPTSASSSTPKESRYDSPSSQKKPQVRVTKPKSSSDKRVVEEKEAVVTAETDSGTKPEKRLGKGEKKSAKKAGRATEANELDKGKKTKSRSKSGRSSSREKKKKGKDDKDKVKEAKPSKSDMSQALMFLQRRAVTVKPKEEEEEDVTFKPIAHSFAVSPKKKNKEAFKPAGQTFVSPRVKKKPLLQEDNEKGVAEASKKLEEEAPVTEKTAAEEAAKKKTDAKAAAKKKTGESKVTAKKKGEEEAAAKKKAEGKAEAKATKKKKKAGKEVADVNVQAEEDAPTQQEAEEDALAKKQEDEAMAKKRAVEAEKPLTPEEASYQDALKFLSNEPLDNIEDAPYFKKLDFMLPKRGSQSKEARAKEMVKALKWMKKQGLASSKASPSEETKAAAPSSSAGSESEGDTSSQELEAKTADVISKGDVRKGSQEIDKKGSQETDYKNCIAWLMSEEDRSSVPDASYFKKLDSMLKKKPGQSTEDRARDMVKALAWVKKSSAKKDAEDGTSSTKETKEEKKMPSKSPRTKPKPKVATKNKKEEMKAPEGKERKEAPEDQKKNEPAQDLTKDPERPPPEPLTEDEQKALDFLKAKLEGKQMSVENAATYKRLDNMMPSKKGQDPEQRAREMVKMLAWLKKRGKAP